MIERRFVLFVAASGVAAVANFSSRIAFNQFIGYVPAIVLAYFVGMVTAFLLNRSYVFKDANKQLAKQIFWFVAVNALALLQTIFISLVLSHYVFPWIGLTLYPETFAHALGIIAPAIASYFGHKHLTFSKSGDYQE
ncbi:GtrA family protein [Xanthomonas oryzae]|uniref:GtrA family protein n=1 Tax=Xanthomonas oryzae TaxID=347 RepID=UPI00103517E9|nr:GtrA family protein [Xanthomonas oryzae]QBG87098.1 GtrA family protein [Xanthomonas oryzae]QBH01089.1 GtrA family protein [Xanthomonas oryzae]